MTTKTAKQRREAREAMAQRMLEQRQALAQDQARQAAAMVNEARNISYNKQIKFDPQRRAIERGLIRHLATALAAEGLNPVINASESVYMRAWTDFRQINVQYKRYDDMRLMMAIMRGLFFHEGGHLKFTNPWPSLKTLANKDYGSTEADDAALRKAWNWLEDQRMETAVVSDSPRKAAYLTPMVMCELLPDLNHTAANWPLLVWRRYLPRHIRDGARKLFVMQHGAKGEALAQECERIVDSYVRATDALTMYNAVVEMERFLRKIKPIMASAGAGHEYQNRRPDGPRPLSIPIDPSMAAESQEGQQEDAEEPEIDTTDPEVAEHLAEVFSHLFIDPWNLIPVEYTMPQEAPQEEPQQGNDSGDEEGEQSESGASGEGDEGDDEGQPGDEQGESGEQPGQSGEGEDEQPESDEGGSTGAHGDEPLTEEDLKEAIEKAEQERYDNSDLDGDMEAFRHALDNQDSKLEVYNTFPSNDARARAEADTLAQAIQDSFQENINDRTPAWIEGQERGVLNVIRYQTRQPWEFDFYRDFVGEENPGFDMAVSVLLDYSSSMDMQAEELAKCGYACKAACDRLDIPCTVVLWDTEAKLLWDATETADFLPYINCTGGTDPGVALADLDNHRRDKKIHLVLIMTDGQWQHGWTKSGEDATRTMGAYKAPDRYFLGFGFGVGGRKMVPALKARGCDAAWAINSLMEIPLWMREAMLTLI